MDFELMERHPWATVAIIGAGGLILFYVFRRRGGSGGGGGSAPGVTYTSQPTDPNATALAAQSAQLQAQLSGLSVQGSTQIQLAQIAAGAGGTNSALAAGVANRQTDAQLLLGVSTIQGQTDQARINASVQLAAIDAIVRAFGGGGTSTPAPAPSAPTVISAPDLPRPQVTNPITIGNQYTPPVPVTIANPNGTDIIPGGTQLVPFPNYIPVGAWPNPLAVAANQQSQIGWENATLTANANNNLNQCIANAHGSDNTAPNQVPGMVAACHASYGG